MTTIVDKLMKEYSGGVMHGKNSLNVFAGKSIVNKGFMGSANVVFLTSLDSISHEAPACIAAPLVNIVAKNVLSLGMAGQGSQPVPVRLYAPEQLTITVKHLSIGDLMLLVEPKHGIVSCKKLTLTKTKKEEPEYFEVIKSWVINDDTEIETVLRDK